MFSFAKQYIYILVFLLFPFYTEAKATITYTNPIIYADYSDPDVCVGASGEDFYMTASSFNCIPGLPILHSKDLVHWTIINHAVHVLLPIERYATPQHGKGIWAPCIRYNERTHLYYIYWGDPDEGVFVVTATDPSGEWTKPQLVIEGKGIIDPAVFWDEDGRCYMLNAYAASRAHINSILSMRELSADGLHAITQPRIVFDGSSSWNHTCEGPKMYKRGEWYWILCPAGGVKLGHQLAMRSRTPYGPYETKTVLQRGSTDINGPHQGALVSLKNGTDWFLHFQDREAYGRVVWLEPVDWTSGWPMMGNNGEPVKTHAMPLNTSSSTVMQTSDDFSELGLQWQWNANYQESYGQTTPEGMMRLFCHRKSECYQNLLEVGNLLLQKLPAENFTATAKLTFTAREDGQCGGILCMGSDYTALVISREADSFLLQQITYLDDNRSNDSAIDNKATGTELRTTLATLKPSSIDSPGFLPQANHIDLYLRLTICYTGGTMPVEYPIPGGQKTTPKHGAELQFAYSTDGRHFKKVGQTFVVRQNKWTGAKIGLMATEPSSCRNTGWIDADWFHVDIQ